MTFKRTIATTAVALAALLGGCSGSTGTVPPPGADPVIAQTVSNDIPARLQWMYNYGYCGETSLVSAGLYYGQYVSQYDVRAIAHPDVAQNLKNSQTLLAGNASTAARRMHLNVTEWSGRNRPTPAFLAWVKRNVERGYPVAIGIYTNEYYFYGKHSPHAGDPVYDHIVPVVGITRSGTRDTGYNGADRITFSDNGLNAPGAGAIGPHPGHWRPLRDYLYTYRFDAFARTRAQANRPSAPPYSLAVAGSGASPRNYGIAVTGVADPAGETLPVRITTSKYYEWPPIANNSNVRPKPESLVLTIVVSNLQPNVRYNLYQYDDFASVPDANFNAHARSASQRWRISIGSGTTYAIGQTIESDRIAVYRAVPASGP